MSKKKWKPNQNDGRTPTQEDFYKQLVEKCKPNRTKPKDFQRMKQEIAFLVWYSSTEPEPFDNDPNLFKLHAHWFENIYSPPGKLTLTQRWTIQKLYKDKPNGPTEKDLDKMTRQDGADLIGFLMDQKSEPESKSSFQPPIELSYQKSPKKISKDEISKYIAPWEQH